MTWHTPPSHWPELEKHSLFPRIQIPVCLWSRLAWAGGSPAHRPPSPPWHPVRRPPAPGPIRGLRTPPDRLARPGWHRSRYKHLCTFSMTPLIYTSKKRRPTSVIPYIALPTPTSDVFYSTSLEVNLGVTPLVFRDVEFDRAGTFEEGALPSA